MNVQAALQSQYHAALQVLHGVIEKCPNDLLYHPADGSAPCWRVIYHTLFYTHFYLHQQQHDFTPWVKHQPEANYIASVAHENHRPPLACKPFTREELLEYWSIVDGAVNRCVETLDLSAPQCGFPWYVMSTLEHQFVNHRHIQHHASILSYRIRQVTGATTPWVGKG